MVAGPSRGRLVVSFPIGCPKHARHLQDSLRRFVRREPPANVSPRTSARFPERGVGRDERSIWGSLAPVAERRNTREATRRSSRGGESSRSGASSVLARRRRAPAFEPGTRQLRKAAAIFFFARERTRFGDARRSPRARQQKLHVARCSWPTARRPPRRHTPLVMVRSRTLAGNAPRRVSARRARRRRRAGGCSAYVARAQAAEHLAVIHDFDQSHTAIRWRSARCRPGGARPGQLHHRGSYRSDGHHRDARHRVSVGERRASETGARATAPPSPRLRGFRVPPPRCGVGSETSSTGATSSRRTTPRVRRHRRGVLRSMRGDARV